MYQRIKGYLSILIIYIAAFLLGLNIYGYLPFDDSRINIIIKLFILDVVATIFIYLMGLIFKNPSFYDPYWSVAPLIMIIIYFFKVNPNDVLTLTLVILIGIWSVRLTINWAIGFNNIKHIDWRYVDLKEKHPKTFFLISLFGIHLLPTILVFVGLLPAFAFIADIGKTAEPSLMTLIGFMIIAVAIIIETIADIQMMLFKKCPSNTGLVLEHGLWKNSRHPNYFGEVMFWVGIFLTYYSFPEANPLLVGCPLFIFILFEFISIPMMEKRQLNSKPAYKEYKEHTNAMLPIFPPKK